MNLQFDWLYERSLVTPDKMAIVTAKHSLTYSELQDKSTLLAQKLTKLGIGKESRIGVLLENSIDYIIVIHAILKLGAVFVPLNTRLSKIELLWEINYAKIGLLLVSEETLEDIDISDMEFLSIYSINENRSEVPVISDVELVQSRDLVDQPVDLEKDFAIVFTSGTTGRPKGVVLTSGNFYWSAVSSAYRLGVLPDDTWLLTIPLYHLGGLAIVIRSCLYGITIKLENGFNEARVIEHIKNGSISLISLVPTMLKRLLDQSNLHSSESRLRMILLGGGAADPNLIEKAISLELPIALTYGMTETASQIATALIDKIKNKKQTVGKPLYLTKIKIFDKNGEEVEHGEIGEIAVNSPTLMRGYLDENNLSNFVGEFFLTGDIGFVDQDGDLFVLQRRIDLIITGGENVYPVEVEQILDQISGIVKSYVVGIEHQEWGQEVCAVLKINEILNLHDVDKILRNNLAGYKIPRKYYSINEYPTTASGKILRREVKSMILENKLYQLQFEKSKNREK